YMRKPKNAPKMAVIGVVITMVVYTLLFVVTIGVVGNAVTSNLLYPTIELAKSVEIPGQFFERFVSVFFVIWVMAIFNTAAIALDIAVLILRSIFTNVSKLKVLYIIAPPIYFISQLPRNIIEIEQYGTVISYAGNIFTVFIPLFI